MLPRISGSQVGSASVDQGETKTKGYLCALVLPSFMSETYEINLWRQIVVDTEAMNAEAFLEYDPATRYYYMAV